MDTNAFAWLVYGLAIAIFITEGLLYVLYMSLLPSAPRAYIASAHDESVELDVSVVKRMILRYVLRSFAPFFVASLAWTIWIILFMIDKDSVFVDGVVFVANGFLFGCFVLFLFSYRAASKIRNANVHTDV